MNLHTVVCLCVVLLVGTRQLRAQCPVADTTTAATVSSTSTPFTITVAWDAYPTMPAAGCELATRFDFDVDGQIQSLPIGQTLQSVSIPSFGSHVVRIRAVNDATGHTSGWAGLSISAVQSTPTVPTPGAPGKPIILGVVLTPISTPPSQTDPSLSVLFGGRTWTVDPTSHVVHADGVLTDGLGFQLLVVPSGLYIEALDHTWYKRGIPPSGGYPPDNGIWQFYGPRPTI